MYTQNEKMAFTMWNVGHGLAIWIKTPAGHNHWIDAGWNGDTDFSPSKRVREYWGETDLDYLIISHPDSDHMGNLPEVVQHLGYPRVFCRNKSLPVDEKYGDCTFKYQKVFRDLDSFYNSPVPEFVDPCNPEYNGGITVETFELSYDEAPNSNDTSVVAIYRYADWAFVCPGDIEPNGWELLWRKYGAEIYPFLKGSRARVLVAPHHGRESGYSQLMMDCIDPDLVLISDIRGQSTTDSRFLNNPNGIYIDGELTKYISMKSKGRVRFELCSDGSCHINVADLS